MEVIAARFILPDGTDLVPPKPPAADQAPPGSVEHRGETYVDPEM